MADEKRLIEVETVVRKIREANCADCDNCNAVLCRACWVDDVISLLDDSPKVDAVEVVLCKDCKMLCRICDHIAQHCSLSGIPVDDDDFCSLGERTYNANM